MLGKTSGIRDLGLFYCLFQTALTDRNCQPDLSIAALDLVAVAPIIFCVLRAIIQNEIVHGSYNVEIAFPRDVV
jgi:hypothetical protein